MFNVVTITREYGSGGSDIRGSVAEVSVVKVFENLTPNDTKLGRRSLARA